MENLKRIVAEHPFCKGLESYYIELLAGCAANVRFEADKYIFREGRESDQFYLVRRGKVALELLAPNRPPIVTETVGAGDVLGWSWIVPPYRWRFNGRAVETVHALALDGKCLRGKCGKNHDLGYELLKRVVSVIGRRLEATRVQILDVYSAGPAAPRLAVRSIR